MGETNTLFGKPIDYRSLDERVAHVGELIVGQLIGHQIHHIWLFWRRLSYEGGREQEEGRVNFHFVRIEIGWMRKGIIGVRQD